MKRLRSIANLIIVTTIVSIFTVSCSKNSTPVIDPNNSSTLLPLKQNDKWIYSDSSYDSTGKVTYAYLDTAYISALTTTYQATTTSGTTETIVLRNFNDSLGWFGSQAYMATDANNSYILEMDGASSTPYYFFEVPQYDGYVLSSGTNTSNPICITQNYDLGYVTPTTVNGYSCYENFAYIKDCNNRITHEVIVYVAPGVGIVQILEYSVDSLPNSPLYLDYSQTLQKYIPAK